MSSKREGRDKSTSKQSSDNKHKDKTECEEATSQKIEKQTKLDNLVTQINKESSMTELINTMNSFDQKLNDLASKEYIEKSMKTLVTEDFVKTMVAELREEIARQLKADLDVVREEVGKRKSSLKEQIQETLWLKK